MVNEVVEGAKIGMLTVLRFSEQRVHGSVAYDCLCECGTEKPIRKSDLKSGKTRSCGCWRVSKGRNMLTKEQWVEKAKEIHGDRYDYSESNYLGNQQFLRIGCNTHGMFTQKAGVHLQGSGCQQCGWTLAGSAHKVDFDVFVSQAREKHGEQYEYLESTYIGATDLMTIVCKDHGEFSQKPIQHLAVVTPCAKCRGKMYTLDDFITKANSIHGEGTYDYSKVIYERGKKKVEMVCPTHGSFWQTPHNHTAGKHGCPACGAAGYNQTLPAKLYVLQDGDVTKVGITNREVIDRVKQINRQARKGFEEVTSFYFENGAKCLNTETEILRYLQVNYKGVEERYDGSSECFIDVNICRLLDEIKKKMEEVSID